MTKEDENAIKENSKFSPAEIKKRLKQKSKSDLINIVINLSLKIDKYIEKNKDTEKIISNLKLCDELKNVDYEILMHQIKKEVK